MGKSESIISFLWGIILAVAFHIARIVFTLMKTRIDGAMVAIWHEGNILLIKKTYRRNWSVPGGLVKQGETWAQAAVRETVEEVGVQVNAEDLTFISTAAGDLGPRDHAHLFQVAIREPVHVQIDRREIRAAEFVEPRAALQRALDPTIERYLRSRLSDLALTSE